MSACQRSQQRHAVAELLKDFVTVMKVWSGFFFYIFVIVAPYLDDHPS